MIITSSTKDPAYEEDLDCNLLTGVIGRGSDVVSRYSFEYKCGCMSLTPFHGPDIICELFLDQLFTYLRGNVIFR